MAKIGLFSPDSAPKMHSFSSSMSKRLCSISPLPVGSFHYFEHKNTKKSIRFSFHFIISELREQKSPISGLWFLFSGLPAPVLWVDIKYRLYRLVDSPHRRITVYSSLFSSYCSLIGFPLHCFMGFRHPSSCFPVQLS
jgi:hypothetical protein